MVSDMTECHEAAVTHPSGWWKASDGNWYPPSRQPGEHDEVVAADSACDLVIALVIAVTAFVLASFVPWTHGNGNVTLLLAGTAGAFFTRWWVFGRLSSGLAR